MLTTERTRNTVKINGREEDRTTVIFNYDNNELENAKLGKVMRRFYWSMTKKNGICRVCFPCLTKKQEKQLDLMLFL